MAKQLTAKQKVFVAEYLSDMNATRAAISAGYSPKSADCQASQLLANPKVADFIARKTAKRFEKLEITADRVIQELAKIGFSNMLDYMQVNENGNSFDMDFSALSRDQAAAIQEITVDATGGGGGDGERRRVERTRFKLGDKRGSLELLGKHLKLFTDKTEVTGKDGAPIEEKLTVTFVHAK